MQRCRTLTVLRSSGDSIVVTDSIRRETKFFRPLPPARINGAAAQRLLEDLDRDIHDHIARETEDNIARGMSPSDAHYASADSAGRPATHQLTFNISCTSIGRTPTGMEENVMDTQLFSARTVRNLVTPLAASLALFIFPAQGWAANPEPGMIGIVFRQLFSDTQPNHRGPLAVMHVFEETPAAKAGIHCSDFVAAVNGVPTPGRAYEDILKADLSGPAGSTVRLTVLRFDGSQSEISLVRAPYPPHSSRASDPFAYTVPGNWSTDPRYTFPLPWWPAMPYRGFEDVFFSPNFDQEDSPEYHSFLFFLSLDGARVITAEQLQSDILAYFRGIAQERGRNYGFTPDLSKVSAAYQADSGASQTFGGAAARVFGGTLTIYDTHGKTITLNSEVLVSDCGRPDKTILFVGNSLEPRNGDMWKRIDAIRDTFRCSR